MHPDRVSRDCLNELTDLPNVGPATAGDLVLLGIHKPQDLAGKDALTLYQELSRKTGVRQDPCVLDVFLSIVGFIDGDPPRPWWDYTAQRKERFPNLPTGR